jgi:hypothetical protein
LQLLSSTVTSVRASAGPSAAVKPLICVRSTRKKSRRPRCFGRYSCKRLGASMYAHAVRSIGSGALEISLRV